MYKHAYLIESHFDQLPTHNDSQLLQCHLLRITLFQKVLVNYTSHRPKRLKCYQVII